MTKKTYTPIGLERKVVDTFRWLADDPNEAQKQKDGYVKQYGPTTIIEKQERIKQEWSWRTDSSYEVREVFYEVSCIMPVYSKADQEAMWEEERKEMFDRIAKKINKMAKR